MAGFGVSMPFLRAHAARAKGGLFMLQVQNLTIVHQKDLRVLIKDLSFTLSGTERLAVIGEEGDGKTTLLHLICSWPEVPSWCLAEGTMSSPSEKLGFLPGDLTQKVDPYLRPLFDAMYDFMGPDAYTRLIDRGIVEVAPLAYMRGRTLSDAFIK